MRLNRRSGGEAGRSQCCAYGREILGNMHKRSKVQMGGTHAWSPGDKTVFFSCRTPIQFVAAQSMVVSW